MNRQEQLKSLKVELEQNWKRYRGESSSTRGPENPLGLIGLFVEGVWEDGEVSPELDSSELTKVTTRDYGSDLTEANKRLMAAAKGLNLEAYPRIQAIHGEKKHHVVWHFFNPPQQTSIVVSSLPLKFKRVVVVGKVWLTEAAADFMIGCSEMAKSLGVELVDARGDVRLDSASDAVVTEAQLEKHPLMAKVDELKLEREEDAVIVMFDHADKLRAQTTLLKKKGFRVVTTSANGTVRKNDTDTGLRLAERCIDVQKEAKEKAIVLVIRFPWASDEKSHGQRGESLSVALQDDPRFEVKVVLLDGQHEPPFHAAGLQAVEKLKTEIKMAEEEGKSVVAIFPRAEVVTSMVAGYIRCKNLAIRVYSERLLSTDLRLLTAPDSPLDAVCGVSFYSYGRWAVRAAAYRWAGDAWPEAQPILATREVALEKKICSLDRLFSQMADQDPELEDSKFCWHPDMPGRRVKGW